MRKHIWVLLAYLFLSLVLTWPMVAQFATHVPGDGIDDPALAWNLWWVKHSLVDQPQNPFACDWQFWPIGINLAFYTLTILNGLLSVPLQVTFGIIPAYNILLLSSFVLSGLGAYLLCLDFLRRETRGLATPSPRLRVSLSPCHRSSAVRFMRLLQPRCFTQRWDRETSPARSGFRLRCSTCFAPHVRKAGCAMLCWRRCFWSCRPMQS